MTGYSRADRVGGLIQQILSDLLRRDISDPRLQMVTITACEGDQGSAAGPDLLCRRRR